MKNQENIVEDKIKFLDYETGKEVELITLHSIGHNENLLIFKNDNETITRIVSNNIKMGIIVNWVTNWGSFGKFVNR